MTGKTIETMEDGLSQVLDIQIARFWESQREAKPTPAMVIGTTIRCLVSLVLQLIEVSGLTAAEKIQTVAKITKTMKRDERVQKWVKG